MRLSKLGELYLYSRMSHRNIATWFKNISPLSFCYILLHFSFKSSPLSFLLVSLKEFKEYKKVRRSGIWRRTFSARNYRPSFRENKPKTLVLYDWKRAFWACFRENWVYKFGHSSLPVPGCVTFETFKLCQRSSTFVKVWISSMVIILRDAGTFSVTWIGPASPNAGVELLLQLFLQWSYRPREYLQRPWE